MVEIPIPPSANHLWRAVGVRSNRIRMVRNARYNGWLSPAVFLLRAGLPRFVGPVCVEVVVRGGKGFPKSRDIDNCLKPCVDALRHAGVIADDTVEVVRSVLGRYEPPARAGDAATCFVSVRGAELPHPGGAESAVS